MANCLSPAWRARGNPECLEFNSLNSSSWPFTDGCGGWQSSCHELPFSHLEFRQSWCPSWAPCVNDPKSLHLTWLDAAHWFHLSISLVGFPQTLPSNHFYMNPWTIVDGLRGIPMCRNKRLECSDLVDWIKEEDLTQGFQSTEWLTEDVCLTVLVLDVSWLCLSYPHCSLQTGDTQLVGNPRKCRNINRE